MLDKVDLTKIAVNVPDCTLLEEREPAVEEAAGEEDINPCRFFNINIGKLQGCYYNSNFSYLWFVR